MEGVIDRSFMNKRVYLDSNATTPPSKEVVDVMYDTAITNWGNPSSLYSEGVAARKALNYSRDVYANVLKTDPQNVYFTSCGTESNNIAIRSIMIKAKERGRDIIITSSVEHPSIRVTSDAVKCKHVEIPVDEKGYLRVDLFKTVLERYGKRVGMISIIMAQNEFGTIQSIGQLTTITREYAIRSGTPVIPFHTDATQIFGKYPDIMPDKLGVDVMTGSAHKFHGPRGVGMLFLRKGLIEQGGTTMTGGGQEMGCRSGTENIPAIFSSATALLQAVGDRSTWFATAMNIKRMRDDILSTLKRNIPGVIVNGDPINGLYNTLNISFPGISGHEMVEFLDRVHISVSGGSACSKGEPSKSMLSLYGHLGKKRAEDIARGAIRISLNRYNTSNDCDYATSQIIGRWRMVSG